MIVNSVERPPTGQTVDDNFLGIGYQNLTEHWTQVKSLLRVEHDLSTKWKILMSEKVNLV